MITAARIRGALAQSAELDAYLTDIAQRTPTHRFLGGATQACYVRMINLLATIYKAQERPLSTVRVLDWGTGKGHISYLMRSLGFNVTSCDLKSIAGDSTFGQVTPILEEQSLEVVPLSHPWILPFQDQQFDLVVSFGVLEHVENDFESLKEIRRVLKPEGVFFFSFLPYWLSWSQWLARLRGDWYHPRLYRKKMLKHMAEAAGFSVGGVWHGQLLPKNSFPHNNRIERADRFATTFTPLKYFATNLEGILVAE